MVTFPEEILNGNFIFCAVIIVKNRKPVTESGKGSYKLSMNIWENVFKSGPNKICGRQPLKTLKGYGLLKFR